MEVLLRLMWAMPVLAVFVFGAATAEDAPARRIIRPDWVRTPTAEEVQRAYPGRGGGVAGLTRMRCVVLGDGTLSDCVVFEENPPDKGFGEAALQLEKRFRMKANAGDGQPVAGGVIDIPIRFSRY